MASSNFSDSQRKWMAQLSGCKVGRVFDTKERAEKAIIHLATCELHKGEHHFAVFEEGRGVAMSLVGWACIESADGILDQPKHEHDWSEWSYAVYPAGRRICNTCGEIQRD